MATNNFYFKNTKKFYAIGLDYEQPIFDEDGNETDETETVSCESWEYDEQRDYIIELLNEKTVKPFNCLEYDNVRSQYDNRNFDARYIASLTTDKNFGDVNVDIRINCFSRCGYYEGACLDYEFEINIGNIECDERDVDVVDVFVNDVYYTDMNAGMLKIQGSNAQKWVYKTIDAMVEIIEDAFESGSTTFNYHGSMSNGEGVYSKCVK